MSPERITVALDKRTLELLEKMNEEGDSSRSSIVRQAIRFFYESKNLREHGADKLNTYLELLSEGEHVVLDVDHWLLFLQILESSPKKEEFWKKSKKVAESHADQLSSKVKTLEDLLERLAACNFFRINKVSEKEFTLLVNSGTAKKFVKRVLKDFAENMGFKVKIQEDIGKIRVKKTE